MAVDGRNALGSGFRVAPRSDKFRESIGHRADSKHREHQGGCFTMKATASAPQSGPEYLARQHYTRSAGQRNAQTLYRRMVRDRAYLESDDLRPCHQEQLGLRRRHPREAEQGKSGEALFFELALEDITRAAALFQPIHDRTDGVDGWVSLEVSPLARPRHRQQPRRRQGSPRARGAAEPVHQNPRHQGRSAGHRGSHLRRYPDQRHSVVLPRAIPGGMPTRSCAASSGASSKG